MQVDAGILTAIASSVRYLESPRVQPWILLLCDQDMSPPTDVVIGESCS